MTTDCRALGDASAAAMTAQAVTALLDDGVERLFLKIDSTMRGSVRGQVAGALAAWRSCYPDARAVVCPAYPSMGRTVASNRLLVHGEPVERTVFGRDPVTPVNTSDMTQLLPQASHISLRDAATDADLAGIAEMISAAGPHVIAVGSGGLAGALASALSGRALNAGPDVAIKTIPRRHNPRILLQVSSMNPVSRAQAARLKAACPDVVVLLAPEQRGDSGAVVESLARQFAAHLETGRWDAVGLIGGDGARGTLAHLGASGIRIIDSVLEGIPFGVIVGGAADGMPVFTKAGGFGTEDALVKCVERMTA